MEIREISDNGIQFLINEEGMILHPYKDSAGIPTIGIGCTYYENGNKVKMTDPPITKERAISLFKNLLQHYMQSVYSVTRDDINHNQFDSMVSLSFNIGTGAFKASTLVKRVNANPIDPTITDAFLMWKNAGGKPILLARRKREAALYFKPENKEIFKLTPDLMYDEHIKIIQRKLGLKDDGWFGPKTAAAVIAFQKSHGLTPDGIVGPRTLEILNQ